jgi:hypothetical protein
VPVTLQLVLALALFASTTLDLPTRGAQQAPACTASEYHQFDFWLGDWTVADAAGRPQGHNHIERTLSGCVLHESWTATDGSKGESFNIYDQWAGHWHQTWVDEHGMLLQLDGGLRDGVMVLEGARLSPAHVLLRHRITWTPVNERTVRQHWQRSSDGGKSWETVFDGTYVRTAAP